ncbi:galactosamine-6-phosphate isomerase [Mucilaginibacter koreensis]
MQIIKFDTPEALNKAAADFMVNTIKENPQALLCPATGNSPTGAYRQLVQQKEKLDTSQIKVVKLDEWAGLPMNHTGSCEYYLQKELLQPLGLPAENYMAFNSESDQPDAECERIQKYLNTQGPVDLCILGLGLNGHIAFNDPAETLQPDVHLARLSEASLAHPMVQDVAGLTHGYTLGMADILKSKNILLIVNGRHKHNIFQQLMKKEIGTQLPASLLWLHAHAYCYYCED